MCLAKLGLAGLVGKCHFRGLASVLWFSAIFNMLIKFKFAKLGDVLRNLIPCWSHS